MKTTPIIAAAAATALALAGVTAATAPADAAGKNFTGYVALGHGRATITYLTFSGKSVQKHITLPYTQKLTTRHVSGSKFLDVNVFSRDLGPSDDTGCKVVKNGHVLVVKLPKKKAYSVNCTVEPSAN